MTAIPPNRSACGYSRLRRPVTTRWIHECQLQDWQECDQAFAETRMKCERALAERKRWAREQER